MFTALRLPLQFDPGRLGADLECVRGEEWVGHFNTDDYEGDWSGVALRSVGGGVDQIYPDPSAPDGFRDTELMTRCPYFATVLATFECRIDAARLLKLRAGSSIREHRDFRLGFEDGEVRIHVPIVTDPSVAFFLAGGRIPLQVGECWYLNVNLPHRVENRSETDRVHLVFDCHVNPWVRDLFDAAARKDGATYHAPTSLPDGDSVGDRNDWEGFQANVLNDEGVMARLRDISDPEDFLAGVRDAARSAGWSFTADELSTRIHRNRNAFLKQQGRLVR